MRRDEGRECVRGIGFLGGEGYYREEMEEERKNGGVREGDLESGKGECLRIPKLSIRVRQAERSGRRRTVRCPQLPIRKTLAHCFWDANEVRSWRGV